MKGLIVLVLIGASLGALPPQLSDVRGFLQSRQGPVEDFTKNLETVSDLHPQSVFLHPRAALGGDIYRADYIFDGLEVVLFQFDAPLAELYPWRIRNQLCSGRSLLLLSDRGLVAAGLELGEESFLVLLEDRDMDICGFLDSFLPLQAYFNPGGAVPQFPGALGTLP